MEVPSQEFNEIDTHPHLCAQYGVFFFFAGSCLGPLVE